MQGMDLKNSAQEVPIVDLSPFMESTKDNSDAQKYAANDLAKKLRQSGGCVGITGHGVSPEILEHAFGIAEKLFQLPFEDKMKAPHPKAPVPHRGYSGVGKEQGAAKTALESGHASEQERYKRMKDYKETYEIGSDNNPIHGNIWLPEEVFPGFRKQTTQLYWELAKTAKRIVDALILSLGLTDEESKNAKALFTGDYNQLRLAYYPPVNQEMCKDLDLSRLGAHRDFSFFTLLFQDATGGLEFQNPQTGEFIPATPKEGVVYMNLGDMSERLSNGFYRSILHRVVIKSPVNGDNTTPARYSIPYFVSPIADATIEPQPSLVKAHGQRNYEPVTPRSYAQQMFAVLNRHDKE